jgi:hypothetical protein
MGSPDSPRTPPPQPAPDDRYDHDASDHAETEDLPAWEF